MKKIYLLSIAMTCITSSLFLLSFMEISAQGNGQNLQFDLEVDGLTRQYTLYVPEGYDGTEEWPVVICLPGFTCTIYQMQEMTKLYQVADTAKFFIVYPQGLSVYLKWFDWTGTGWNIPDYVEANQDDVAFISQIIDDLNANPEYSIDLNRVYATGQSSGGNMAYYLAFMLSNRIASVAGIPGQMSDTLIKHICAPVRQISVLHMQGTNDWAFPRNGNEICLPLEGVTDYWASVNGCNAIPESIELEDVDKNDLSTVTLFNYSNCDDDFEVLLYRINGGGHTWPGGYEDPAWGWGTDIINMDINASVEIWNFFKRNPHPNPWVDIPDTAFLYALIDEGVDTNADSLISYAEAETVTNLVLPGRDISDLTGIEAFVLLETLDCFWNNLTSLDVSNNIALVKLMCAWNELTSLDVSKNTSLKELFCSGNELTSLDLSNNVKLTSLTCGDRPFPASIISANPLTSLKISNCTALKNLHCNGCKLNSLDIRNNDSIEYLDLADMPTLNEVCIWETFNIDSIEIDLSGSPNVCFETVCDGACASTNIDGQKLPGLLIYPNPANDLLTIETDNIGQQTIEITSLNGQIRYSTKMEGPTHQIDLSSFQKGLYFITVRSKDFVRTEKVIKL